MLSKRARPLVVQLRIATRRARPAFRGAARAFTAQAGAGQSQYWKFALGGLGIVSVSTVLAASHYGVSLQDILFPEKKKEAPPPLEVPEPPSDDNTHPYDHRSVSCSESYSKVNPACVPDRASTGSRGGSSAES